jgi:hypothetical protein
MLNLICPQCRQTVTVSEASAGQQTNCPTCGSLIDVPHTPAADAPPPLARVVSAVPPQPSTPPLAQEKPVPAEAGWSKSRLTESASELTLNAIVLGAAGLLASPGIVTVRPAGVFPVVLMGITVLGLGGLALALGILGLLGVRAQQMQGFWYALSGLVLSGLAILLGLTMLIGALTISL